MDTETTRRAPILEIAWQRHADLDLAADRRTLGFYSIRKWIAQLGILTTLFAILTQQFFQDLDFSVQPFSYYATIGWVVKTLFIATPLLSSIFAAFASKFYSNRSWLIYRVGAEEIKREIYFYRTVWKNDPERHRILRRRLAQIQKQLSRSLGGEFAFEGYKGPLPSNYWKDDPSSDPGFHDLTGEEYVKYRLKRQLDWHNNRVNQRKRERRDMNIFILAIGSIGTLLAALGGPLSIWVALTASLIAALLGWQELRRVDETIKLYSKVVSDLTILYDWWHNLEIEEQTERNFHKLVMECEKVLWAPNLEYTHLLQEVSTDTEIEEEATSVESAKTVYG